MRFHPLCIPVDSTKDHHFMELPSGLTSFSKPKPWTMKPSIDPENGVVMLGVQDYAGRITQEIMRTKEKAIREALIALGWTPPVEPPEWWNENHNNGRLSGVNVDRVA